LQLGFVGSDCQQTRPVDHLGFPHVLGQAPLAQGIYRLSDGDPSRFCVRRRRYDSAFYDLHGAYLGEPPPRKVEGEAEQADALMST